MPDHDRTFAVASDETMVELISGAHNRLVVVAPAVTTRVANALARRLDELGHLDVTVVLDSDPEVYRLGFGDLDALETIRSAAANNLFDLREQSGVRIGIVIADGTTLVYSPVSKNIEAGSTSEDKPNAIILRGAAADCIASAAGADNSDLATRPEVGGKALEPAKVQQMQANLKANPPKPFDITRRLNVFSSKVQYVEFSASNYRLTTRQIPLPPELVDVADDDLKKRITGRIRGPFDGVGKLKIEFVLDQHKETVDVDDDWLKKERKRIEDEYTFQINNFVRVILSNDRGEFDKETKRFRVIVEKYQTALTAELAKSKVEFVKRIVDEFSRRWEQNPPRQFLRWGVEANTNNINRELQSLAERLFSDAVSFDPPVVKVLYKRTFETRHSYIC
jgi:hypothetical protein